VEVGYKATPFDTFIWVRHEPDKGRITVYYDDKRKHKALEVDYLGNKRFSSTSWYSNGIIRDQKLNIDSLPYYEQDMEMWYPDGQQRLYTRTTADSMIAINWFNNGEIVYDKRVAGTGHWNFSKCTGITKTYNKLKVVRLDIFYFDSTEVDFLFSSGRIATKTIYFFDNASAFGSHEHFQQSYNENGTIATTPIYAELGRQAVTWYDSTGHKTEEGDWLNGRIGVHREYYQNGSLKAEGEYTVREKHFTTTTSVNYCPVKSGHWKFYDETGKMIREEWYDELNRKFKTYDANGNVLTEGDDKIEAIGCG
jgi:antitoxin component YwqK of YwqJK toxin-antitoxin module